MLLLVFRRSCTSILPPCILVDMTNEELMDQVRVLQAAFEQLERASAHAAEQVAMLAFMTFEESDDD